MSLAISTTNFHTGTAVESGWPRLITLYRMQGQDTVIVVVMEFCDLGSLLRAVTKKAFKPHGKWSYHTTYVSLFEAL